MTFPTHGVDSHGNDFVYAYEVGYRVNGNRTQLYDNQAF